MPKTTTKSNATAAFSTVKVKSEFLWWLHKEAARRGMFIYELVEDLASRSIAGKRPWDPTAKPIQDRLKA